MKKTTIVYFTHTGVTKQLIEACKKGLESANVEVQTHQILGKEIVEGRFANQALFETLLESDAIVFATPTYMGSVSAQFKAFADASSEYWGEQKWADKLATGITCGSAMNGDQSSTLAYMNTLANQHGMFWVGLDSAYGFKDHGVNRMGCQLGVVAWAEQDGVADERDKETAFYLGTRVGKVLCKN